MTYFHLTFSWRPNISYKFSFLRSIRTITGPGGINGLLPRQKKMCTNHHKKSQIGREYADRIDNTAFQFCKSFWIFFRNKIFSWLDLFVDIWHQFFRNYLCMKTAPTRLNNSYFSRSASATHPYQHCSLQCCLRVSRITGSADELYAASQKDKYWAFKFTIDGSTSGLEFRKLHSSYSATIGTPLLINGELRWMTEKDRQYHGASY